MVTKLTYDSGLGGGLSSLGASIAQALKERSKKQQISDIMKPMVDPEQQQGQESSNQQQYQQPQADSVLEGVVGKQQQQEQQQPQQIIPVADKIYNKKMAQIQHMKKQATALEEIGQHPQAQMMMQEAHQQEQFLQQERLQDKKLSEKVSSEKDKRAFDENKDYYTRLGKIRTEMPQKEATLLGIRDALINSGGKIGKLQNYISTFFPAEQADYISKSSAQQLSSFVKDYFVADLREIPGMRLNQMIESNLKSALQAPGKTEESNQVITEFQQFKNDILNKELEISDRIKNQYLKVGREPPRNFQEQVSKQLKPYAQEKQKELLQTYQDIKQGKFKSAQILNMPFLKAEVLETPAKQGFTWVASPNGKKSEIPNDVLQEALNSGGKVIK